MRREQDGAYNMLDLNHARHITIAQRRLISVVKVIVMTILSREKLKATTEHHPWVGPQRCLSPGTDTEKALGDVGARGRPDEMQLGMLGSGIRRALAFYL